MEPSKPPSGHSTSRSSSPTVVKVLIILAVAIFAVMGAAWTMMPRASQAAALGVAGQLAGGAGGGGRRVRGVGFASYEERLKAELENLDHVVRDFVGGAAAHPPKAGNINVQKNAASPTAAVPAQDEARDALVLDLAREKIHELLTDAPVPPPKLKLSHTKDTIFVSMAAFRDVECGPTIQDIYAKALAPQRIYMGVVEQTRDSDPVCMQPLQHCSLNTFCLTDNVRFRRVQAKAARGPTFGRFMAGLLYHGEKFFMMIDSHNRFVPKWDQVALNIYDQALTQSKKPVLSHYPLSYDVRSDGKEFDFYPRSTTKLCKAGFHQYGYPRLEGIIVSKGNAMSLQPWAAAGFLFADAKLIHEVPFDPHLDFLFDGEEILYSVRMWTHGWDMFSPNDNILFHMYGRPDAPKVWSENEAWGREQIQSARRVQYFLQARHPDGKEIVERNTTDERVVREEDKYGLGHARTLEEYWAFSGIDMHKRSFTKKWC